MAALRDFHGWFAYVAIVSNGLAGIAAMVAWRIEETRGRWLWVVVLVAEAAMMLQVLVGVILIASKDYTAPSFHMFYGFLAFLTVGLAYQYRFQMRGRRELLYGLAGLFLMGLGIRAVFQVS
jgi:hypothetical protein